MATAVEMKQQTRRFPAVIPCGLKSINGELDIDFGTDLVSDYFSCEQVDNNAEIIETAVQTDVSDIADSNLIWSGWIEGLL